ncbi:MAG: phosphoenolpyruvate carboxykinase (GTP) [Candidatus Altiarchaeales archaeon]|nr:phosphoenolpyruvate carboxykinase (GTP) [Candidatus Altiarchaeota archaeon]MBU4341894.1 phosphoenolpyruvate carboxykinase (GTP) [Candidatus Altiarchaeota archaeon]MCG2782939.1 phosphoenolpyruvate carboxykinase (GTP) [Candidatus Altiarchaeales archaeon]
MGEEYVKLLKSKCGIENYEKLMALNNPALNEFVVEYVKHCNPASVFVRTDSLEDARYIRNKALENGEEKKLATEGHTAHFDGYYDQARDKENTKYLLPPDVNLGPNVNAIDREEGLREVHEYSKNIMEGKEMYVCFFCLGPTNSEFSIPAVQLTDSAYVAHSEGILYRSGYEEFKRIEKSERVFKVVHSAGVLENGVSKNIDKRRIYIDLEGYVVYSTNTQYAGNTVGFKKLSLQLAIHKASQEGWLAEHMFILGVHGPNGRKTYFTGAFPSFCGKTSTCMVKDETVIGDDIAYLRKSDGKVYAANTECGIFGIIKDVNSGDDPLIWKALIFPGEVIFSNVLVTGYGIPYWLGDGRKIPEKGINYSGEWFKGEKDSEGNEILHTHKNAGYTVSLYTLKNCDPKLDDPQGVEINGIVYGGRDSDTWVPVQQAFDWNHGVLTMGAALESETTAATPGQEGVRMFNPMSNLDFLSIPMGRYINNHLEFGEDLDNSPSIFAVNYFLKDKDGGYITGMEDKRVWLKWMELRVHDDVEAIKTPTGYIPNFEDLKRLFKKVLDKDYTEEDYVRQFTLRIPENLAKIERITKIYKTKVSDAPDILLKVLEEQKQRLEDAKVKHGDYIVPNVWCQ